MLNKKGLTLIEMMIALVVLLLVSLAMMQTALVSIDANMTNALRDEAVNIAEMRMSEARNIPFTTATDSLTNASDAVAPVTTGCFGLPSSPCPATGFASGNVVKSNLRNINDFCFCTNRSVTSPATDARQVDIKIGWKWKGQDYTHTISTIVRRQ